MPNKVEGVAKAWGGTSVDSQRQQRTRWWKALASDVAIAHGKGIILKDAYEKMSDFFSSFIQTRFNITFAKAGPNANGGRYFIMDNDLCQTSRKSIFALNDIEAELHRIPPRSPDLNPIENTFHFIKKKLADEALKLKIEK